MGKMGERSGGVTFGVTRSHQGQSHADPCPFSHFSAAAVVCVEHLFFRFTVQVPYRDVTRGLRRD